MSERELELTPSQTLAFFASVIKSGEPWTATCQKAYDEAQAALLASRQSILEEAAKVAGSPYSDAVAALGTDEPFAVGAKIAAAIRSLSPDGKAPAKEGDEG